MAEITLMGVKGGPAIRPGSNMPSSTLLRMGGKTILVDAGLGVTRGLCDAGVPLTDLDLIVITHLHSDHYLELGPLFHTAWTAGLTRPVPVIGPVGLEAYWQGFLASMAFDIDLRQQDEGRVPLAPLFQWSELTEGELDGFGLSIRVMRNDHPPIHDSYALRFESDGASVVLSGDTAYMEAMITFAAGADLLVHEAMLPAGVEALVARMTNGDARLRTHILRSHTSAEDVGRLATQAGVARLVLTHRVPDSDPDFPDSAWETAVRRHWAGPLWLAADGMRFTL